MANLIAELESRGFIKHHTGGNCTAYVRDNMDGSSEWITDADGGNQLASDSWMYARYSTDNRTVEGEVIDCIDSESSPLHLLAVVDLDPR